MATDPIVIDPATGERVTDNAPQGKPQIDPATGERVTAQASGGAPGLDLANKAGEGTYNMWDTGGKMHPVPYSLVPVAHSKGFQFDTNKNPAGLTPEQQFAKDTPGFWESLGHSLGVGAEEDQATVREAHEHPFQFIAKQALGPGLGAVQGAFAGAKRIAQEQGKVAEGLSEGNYAMAGQHAIASLPFLGPGIERGADQLQPGQSINPGEVGTALGTAIQAAPALLGAVDDVVPNRPAGPTLSDVGNGVRRLVAGDVNRPIPGTDVTPAARYQSMKQMGIQPSAAEATNSTPLKIAEKVNQNSLTSAGTYADARATNLKALNDYTDHVLDSMSDKGPEEGGAAVQQALLKSHEDLKTGATEAYKDLDAQVGDQPLAGAAGLRQTAREILDANAQYYKDHPELEPTKAMAIVRDLAGAKGSPKPAPAVIPGFGPRPPAPEPAPPPGMTYSELHRLRSDLLDFNNTNPDLVKNQANGWISRLAGIADHAITASESGLAPDQVSTFRNANESWKFMKDTFDNPSHPLYHAVRTPSPSTLVNGITRTPEMARMLQGVLGPEEIGPIQRGVAESLLRTTKDGGYNFKTFQGQWNKLPQAYRDALFTAEQQRQLEDIGNAGTVLHEDLNPSGTAKLGQGQAEMGAGGAAIGAAATGQPAALGATAGYHAVQYALGKLMNSPTFVDWLMRDRGVRYAPPGSGSTTVIPAAVGQAVAATNAKNPHDGPNGQPNFYPDWYLQGKAEFDNHWAQHQ